MSDWLTEVSRQVWDFRIRTSLSRNLFLSFHTSLSFLWVSPPSPFGRAYYFLGCSSVPYLLYKRVMLLFLFHRSLEPADCCYPPKRIDEEVLPIMECKSKSGNPSIVREGSAHPSGAQRWCISESLRNQVYPRVVNPVVYLNCLVDVNPGLVLFCPIEWVLCPLKL